MDRTEGGTPWPRTSTSSAGRSLEDRNREQLYELAKERGIAGPSKMGKWELIEALSPAERIATEAGSVAPWLASAFSACVS